LKIRPSILFLTGSVLVLIVLAVWFQKKQSTETPPTTSIQPSTAVSTNNGPAPVSVDSPPPVIQPVPTNPVKMEPTVSTSAPPGQMDRKQEILSTYNDVPIDFYGKLEDQFGKAVPGAEIKASVRVISGTRQGTDKLTTLSDTSGLFQFHGKGQDISMMPSKKGYALASLKGGGTYSMLAPDEERAHPDANNPVVIKMWKLQGAEPLLAINQRYKIPYTGQPISFDLVSGKMADVPADLRITVNRPSGIISARNPQEWSLKVEAVNGGLINSDGQESVTYAAPETGYQPNEVFTMSTNHIWYQAVHQRFFFTSRNGQIYGKLELSFHINEQTDGLMSVTFTGVANTNSSRNLEADPNTLNVVDP
jgi:hypothetical protein